MPVPLRRLVDDHQWEAEDLAGRLGIVAHAAILRAGFVPYGDGPSSGHLLKKVDEIGPSAPSLSRQYTAAQLARREGAAADVTIAVQELRARGNGDVAFQAYLLTRDGSRRCQCEAVLDEATLAPILCRRLPDAALALEAGSPGSWLWKSLADWVFPALLLQLCRWNDLPVTSFASLPDDSEVEILKRLTDAADLAMVECTSRELRRLVTERDGELWKAMCASPGLQRHVQSSDFEGLGSWKEKYINARRRRRLFWDRFFDFCYDDGERWARQSSLYTPFLDLRFPLFTRRTQNILFPRMEPTWDTVHNEGERLMTRCSEEFLQRHRELQFFRSTARRRRRGEDRFIVPRAESAGFANPLHTVRDDPPAPPREPVVAARGKSAGMQHRKVQRNDYHKKRQGAGAIHSPSSRYRWKHR